MTIIVPDPVDPELQQLNQRELAAQRRMTHAFIQTAPRNVSLVPRTKVRKPSGGFAWQEQAPRPEQVFKLNEPGVVPAPVVTVDGIQRVVEFEMIGEWDSTIGRHDVFELDGARWEVVEVAHYNGWEQRAIVAKFGVGEATVAP